MSYCTPIPVDGVNSRKVRNAFVRLVRSARSARLNVHSAVRLQCTKLYQIVFQFVRSGRTNWKTILVAFIFCNLNYKLVKIRSVYRRGIFFSKNSGEYFSQSSLLQMLSGLAKDELWFLRILQAGR